MVMQQAAFTTILTRPLIGVAVFFLMLSILSAWFTNRRLLTAFLFIIFLLFAVISKAFSVLALPVIVSLALVYYITLNEQYNFVIRILTGVMAILFSLPFATHIVPGVHNFLVVLDYHFTPDSVPYTLYFNFDKPLIGLFILWFGTPLIMFRQHWKTIVTQTAIITFVSIVCLIGLALLLGFTRFEPKFNNLFFIWAPVNLLLVCVAEEAFFRGYLLRYLDAFLQRIWGGRWVGLIFVSILFGIAHYPGGLRYVMLATVAGLFYGYVYQKTKSIGASIICHFSVNMVHFLLFTYPALTGVSALLH